MRDYGECICNIKQKLNEAWNMANEAIKSIVYNGKTYTPDGTGKVEIANQTASETATTDGNVQTDIDALQASTSENATAIATEIADRENADSSMQSTLDASLKNITNTNIGTVTLNDGTTDGVWLTAVRNNGVANSAIVFIPGDGIGVSEQETITEGNIAKIAVQDAPASEVNLTDGRDVQTAIDAIEDEIGDDDTDGSLRQYADRSLRYIGAHTIKFTDIPYNTNSIGEDTLTAGHIYFAYGWNSAVYENLLISVYTETTDDITTYRPRVNPQAKGKTSNDTIASLYVTFREFAPNNNATGIPIINMIQSRTISYSGLNNRFNDIESSSITGNSTATLDGTILDNPDVLNGSVFINPVKLDGTKPTNWLCVNGFNGIKVGTIVSGTSNTLNIEGAYVAGDNITISDGTISATAPYIVQIRAGGVIDSSSNSPSFADTSVAISDIFAQTQPLTYIGALQATTRTLRTGQIGLVLWNPVDFTDGADVLYGWIDSNTVSVYLEKIVQTMGIDVSTMPNSTLRMQPVFFNNSDYNREVLLTDGTNYYGLYEYTLEITKTASGVTYTLTAGDSIDSNNCYLVLVSDTDTKPYANVMIACMSLNTFR